ncbi:hypothetical protein [Leptospira alstonii]|uniref:Uncharacterized protein n=1 Tax=Leptospira alstonii serovar Sichuan str. 79601 TaxID=1218565 RepID=M6D9Z8_9LEPT|nr:hypothetical protein [Leptospira alstonii]AGS80499.1 hypothetical protein LEP1GSC193_0759 [Leptospira phage vB_LalZ_80412-LE1]EMJ95380.1 hypothetical protein LEP1GSC194_3559 [Leptospira alstonii serovar Sichuan str. 79601]
MDEFFNFKFFENEFQHIAGYIASFVIFLGQFIFWFLKKIKDIRSSNSKPLYTVSSPYFHFFGEITRLDIFLKNNLSVAVSEVLFTDLVSLYKKAKDRNLESIKIELAHFCNISQSASLAIRNFVDYVAAFNGIRVVIKFPANSDDAVNLFLDLKKHRAHSDSGRIELYLNDYSLFSGKNRNFFR